MGLPSRPCTPLSPRLPSCASVAPQLRLSCALPDAPSLPKVACNSRTGVTQRHEVIWTGNMSRWNCMRNSRAPHCAPRKVARNSPRTSFTNSSKTAEYQRSHFKTRNILKGITCEIAAPEAASRARGHPSPPGAQRAQAATHPDSLITYPDAPSLPKVARNSPRTSSINSSKTVEYQRSHFKTGNILRGITCETAGQHPCTPARRTERGLRAWPRCRWATAGPGQAHAHQAPPDWRPPRGLRGQAAVPVGGGRAWPGFEPPHQATRQHTQPHWCKGRRRARRARAGFEARRRTK